MVIKRKYASGYRDYSGGGVNDVNFAWKTKMINKVEELNNDNRSDYWYDEMNKYIQQVFTTIRSEHSDKPSSSSGLGSMSSMSHSLPRSSTTINGRKYMQDIPPPMKDIVKVIPDNEPNYDKRNPLLFYTRGEPYYELTNLYGDNETKINIGPITYPSSEAVFQRGKLWFVTDLTNNDNNHYKTELAKATGSEAFLVGSKISKMQTFVGDKWHLAKVPYMYWILTKKFKKGSRLASKLLDTSNRFLIEDSGSSDDYWGNAVKGNVGVTYGKNNWLGFLLMHVRDDLRR